MDPNGNASCAPQGKGKGLWGDWHRIRFPQLWVKEVGQTGTMARHNFQTGQQCCHNHTPIQKVRVHEGTNSPCSMTNAQTARHRMSGSNTLVRACLHNREPDLRDRETPTPPSSVQAASILFADLVGFTAMSSNMQPEEVISVLTLVTCTFDKICAQHDVTKIKTIGDGYMAVCGVPKAVRAHAEKSVDCGLAFIRELRAIDSSKQLNLQVQMRVSCGMPPCLMPDRMSCAVPCPARHAKPMLSSMPNAGPVPGGWGVPQGVDVTFALFFFFGIVGLAPILDRSLPVLPSLNPLGAFPSKLFVPFGVADGPPRGNARVRAEFRAQRLSGLRAGCVLVTCWVSSTRRARVRCMSLCGAWQVLCRHGVGRIAWGYQSHREEGNMATPRPHEVHERSASSVARTQCVAMSILGMPGARPVSPTSPSAFPPAR